MALVTVSREDPLNLAFEIDLPSQLCLSATFVLRGGVGNQRRQSVNDDCGEEKTNQAFKRSTHTSPAGILFVLISINQSDHERALVKPTFAAKIVHGSG